MPLLRGAPWRGRLQSAFETLFQRLPARRPVAPSEEIRMRSHLLTNGPEALPVTW